MQKGTFIGLHELLESHLQGIVPQHEDLRFSWYFLSTALANDLVS